MLQQIFCFYGFVLCLVGGGFVMTKASLYVLREPDSSPEALKWLLFPLTMIFSGNVTTILEWDSPAGITFELEPHWRVSSSDVGMQVLRLKYTAWNCLFFPFRLGWTSTIGVLALLGCIFLGAKRRLLSKKYF